MQSKQILPSNFNRGDYEIFLNRGEYDFFFSKVSLQDSPFYYKYSLLTYFEPMLSGLGSMLPNR